MTNIPTNTNRGHRHIDRTGERIGYITILGVSDTFYINPKTGKKKLKLNYKCDCGNVSIFNADEYSKRKNAKLKTSCGCNNGGCRDTLLLNESGYNTCFKCKETLPISDFGKNKSTGNGLQRSCKKCKSNLDKEYRNDPRFRQRILDGKLNDYQKIRSNPLEWEKYLERQREIRDYGKEYQQMKNDPVRKSKDAIRKLLLSSFKVRNIKKSKLCMKSEEIIGCSFEFFKKHIETQFQQGMSWNNHGDWHLDHIVPLYVAKTIEELIKLNHWTNFQPLWAKENLKKNNILLDEHLELYKSLIKST
jgi:hypothetical protein